MNAPRTKPNSNAALISGLFCTINAPITITKAHLVISLAISPAVPFSFCKALLASLSENITPSMNNVMSTMNCLEYFDKFGFIEYTAAPISSVMPSVNTSLPNPATAAFELPLTTLSMISSGVTTIIVNTVNAAPNLYASLMKFGCLAVINEPIIITEPIARIAAPRPSIEVKASSELNSFAIAIDFEVSLAVSS